ncbi:MAG: anthranilate phosphoribosyltransferase [Runella sp.]
MFPSDFAAKYHFDSALGKGIRQVGIGKHGSKPLSLELIDACLDELRNGRANELQKGAFFGALMLKSPTDAELKFEDYLGKNAFSNHAYFLNKLCPNLPTQLFPIGVKLLSGNTLAISEAHQLGDFLFSGHPCEVFRGMAVSILRVRYESNDEYEGLYEAVKNTYTPGFQRFVKTKLPIVQLSEPFDGVEHCYMITPLLAHFFQQRNYNAVTAVSRTPGPKYVLNSHDLYLYLGNWILADNHELLEKNPPFGWVLDQKSLSPALDQWVERRRTLLKRPFLATLEKVLNPCGAKILVTSVFHITYQMKMAELALMAGFDGVMVLKRGLEGTLAPATSKANGLLCAVRNAKGHLFSTRLEHDFPAFAPFRTDADDEIAQPTVETNATLIRKYYRNGRTDYLDFDNRVNYAKALYMRGLDWIEGQIGY